MSLDPYVVILNPSRQYSNVDEVHILNSKQTICSTNLLIYSAIHARLAMDFAKSDNEDGVVNNPQKKGLL